MQYVEVGQREGARLVCGGHALTKGSHANGWFHEPTIFSDVAPSMRNRSGRDFRAVVSVIRCGSLDEAVAIANDVKYGLFGLDLYARREPRVQAMRDVSTGIFLRQCADNRRGSAFAVRRHQGRRATATRSRNGALDVSRVEVDLRRFQRRLAASANRYAIRESRAEPASSRLPGLYNGPMQDLIRKLLSGLGRILIAKAAQYTEACRKALAFSPAATTPTSTRS